MHTVPRSVHPAGPSPDTLHNVTTTPDQQQRVVYTRKIANKRETTNSRPTKPTQRQIPKPKHPLTEYQKCNPSTPCQNRPHTKSSNG